MHFLRNLFRKKNKRASQNKIRGGRSYRGKKVYSKSRKILKRKNSFYFSSPVISSIIIFTGFMSLSFTIFILGRQFQPVTKNERLKFLCTYQLGDKKSEKYKEAKLKLDKLVGNSEKFCKNFLIPKEKNNKRFRVFPILKEILFRFI